MMMDGLWWWMLMMGFGIVIFAGLIVGGVYLLVRAVRGDTRSSGGSGAAQTSPKAAAILEERFARGEIDRDEFEERRRTLERS